MALIIFYQLKKQQVKGGKLLYRKAWIISSILLFSFLFAFSEEYFWDMFLNREKGAFFATFFNYPFESISLSHWQNLALVILALPQVTHYILDGFIWKMNASNPHLKTFLNSKNNG